ncbi:hypothetical protein B488_04590 [Liberibacter crescens BT-1]|uniref:AI-2E family transporter n=1 Tax=Liberibacter crescens (strain BT-1) TaxID=1215343 RepID=L0EVN2_LIBCB|nr:AI-2E family transporter [Liberibacter crescens]AGA64451.1 hypothetical protein B488_04590 [Liberibacter crescens BT-1]AMC12627.1 ABC transporter permease [Liberibacter crescens]
MSSLENKNSHSFETQDKPRWIGAIPSFKEAILRPLVIARWIIILIVLGAVYFFQGFFVPILTALVIGIASWPLHKRIVIKTGGCSNISSVISLSLIFIILIIPISFMIFHTVIELQQLIPLMIEANSKGLPTPEWFSSLPVIGSWLNTQWSNHLTKPGGLEEIFAIFYKGNIQNIYNFSINLTYNAFEMFLGIIFTFIALFFIYRDGDTMINQFDILGKCILPSQWQRLSRIIPATIKATFLGMTAIAIGEGIVLGIAYWMAGVPSHTTLGILTAIMAMVPGGAPISFTLVSLYLALSGHVLNALLLFSWGTIELFIVDKTLRPFLVGGPIKLPFLPTFFSLIGGVRTMGLLGLFIGPVLMALLVAIWREFIKEANLISSKENTRTSD